MTAAAPRNVHAIPPPPEDDAPSLEANLVLPRLRAVTNDPATEYAQRAGQVEPLPDSVAALILCRKGWAKIERHQIKVTLDGDDLFFASRESMIIAAKNGTGERVLWALNRRAPFVLHLLTDDGRYIESVPRKGEAQWFSQDETSAAAIGDAKAMISRDMARLAELHRPDTEAAAADARHNAAEVRRLVQTFPAESREIAPAVMPRGDAIVAAMTNAEQQRGRQTEMRETARHSVGSLDEIEPAAEPVTAAAPYEDGSELDLI